MRSNHLWDFLLVMLAATAATPAFGQAVTAPVGLGRTASQSAVSIPDVSGTWVYPWCCGFAPPPSGTGPVLRRRPQLSAAGAPLPGAANAQLASELARFVGDHTSPILKPQAADVVRRHGEVELSGVPYPTPRNQCWPEGVPFIFANMGIQILQQPDKVTIFYEFDHQVRQVRMNQPHPAQVTPSWYGDSVGHYDGETLVIDTVGIKLGPFSMIDWYGTPYTEALHVVERYGLVDYEIAKAAEQQGAKENRLMPGGASGATGLAPEPNYRGKALQLHFTVEDEGVFTMPWSATITYWRSFGEWPEHVCAESLRATYVWRESAIPRADKPDF